MKLVRESIKLGSEYNGKWHFIIRGNDAALLEKVEDILSSMTSDFGSNHNGVFYQEKWEEYCDGCPCYEDGYSSGYWIPVDMVPEFKDAWKKAKKL